MRSETNSLAIGSYAQLSNLNAATRSCVRVNLPISRLTFGTFDTRITPAARTQSWATSLVYQICHLSYHCSLLLAQLLLAVPAVRTHT